LEEGAYTKEELESYERYWDSVRVEKALIYDALNEGRLKGEKQGRLEGERQGQLIGKIEGKEEEKVEAIIAGHLEGLSLETLAKIARIAVEEVSEILQQKGLL